MRKIEQKMLQAALVSWVVTHVMDGLLVIVSSIRNLNQPHLKYALLRGAALTTSHSAISFWGAKSMTANRRIFLNIVAKRSSFGRSFRSAHSLADSMTCAMGRSLYAFAIGLFTARWVLMSLCQVDYGLVDVVGGLTAFVSIRNSLMAGVVGHIAVVV